MENKAYQTQIKNIHVNIAMADSSGDRGTATQRATKGQGMYDPAIEEKARNPSYLAYTNC